MLPYANTNEERDDWRHIIDDHTLKVVEEIHNMKDAAIALNKHVWDEWGIVFKANQTPEILSPSQTIKHGYASCTGLSILLVDALRIAGIPARIVGTVDWNKPSTTDEFKNHNWVEVWIEGEWYFTGAHEMSK